ncbi:hypothetical protein HZI73_10070 [Vallitalea pronyensis]|uniref:Uncharacterized protein n=1 Tax=Vallitalea pronyensis TaxID=1348613 RepID=A0A8J8MJB0_9FIRM|nr:hypothetical protein [Vallitalea pronyensis]QUI22624.1 hypothetical protein HZI73_10070 [Vallitalea pronyensis]
MMISMLCVGCTQHNQKYAYSEDHDKGHEHIEKEVLVKEKEKLGEKEDKKFIKKLEDVYLEKMIELPLDFISQKCMVFAEKMSDGYILRSVEEDRAVRESSTVVNTKYDTITLRRIDRQGNLLWAKPIHIIDNARILQLKTFKDDHFIVVVSCAYNDQPDYVMYYDEMGQMLWKHDVETYQFYHIKDVLMTTNENILFVGETMAENECLDIKIVSLNKTGNHLQTETYGGEDLDYVCDVQYHKDIGIILLGRSDSQDGDFAPDNEKQASFVAYINEALEIKMVKGFDDLCDQPMLISENQVFVFFNKHPLDRMPLQSIKSAYKHGIIQALDIQGHVIKTYELLMNGFWTRGRTLLPNGDILVGIGVSQGIETDKNRHRIIRFNHNLKPIHILANTHMYPGEIVATDDGGFIMKMTRSRNKPQPIYSSYLDLDRETVIAKYNKTYQLEWRKTYNMVNDFFVQWVMPTENGWLFIPSEDKETHKTNN